MNYRITKDYKNNQEMKREVHYYQTTPLTPSELLEAQGRAISQEDRIYQFMKGGSEWTAWELLRVGFGEIMLTSLRRSLFNLEKEGKITRVRFVPGPKGKPCGSYKVNNGLLF